MKKELLIGKSPAKPFSFKARIKSIGFALEGVISFFKTEHNAFIHLFCTITVFAAAFLFNLNRNDMIAIILATGFVWVAEIFNTAVEKAVDFFHAQYHPKVKLIKDISAAAVLIASLTAVITGFIVFLPKFLK